MHSDKYRDYADLAAHEKEGADYRITVLRRPSPIAVIAPHGGGIEPQTATSQQPSRAMNSIISL